MLCRTLLIFLLVISLMMTTTVAARPSLPQDKTTATVEVEKLTPDEEREARAIAEDFIARLAKTDDVAPLVKDLYIEDFASRLRGQMESLFPHVFKQEVVAQMSDDEILRAYAAFINCTYLTFRLYIAAGKKRELARARRSETDDAADEREMTFEEMLPPSVIKLIQSDPALNAMLEQEREEEREKREDRQNSSEGQTAPAPEKAIESDSPKVETLEDLLPFKNIEDVRHYTSLAEQGAQLLREHLKSLPPELTPQGADAWHWLQYKSDKAEDVDEDEDNDPINPRPYVLNSKFMGYPEGTRIICADVLMFHMDIVRAADGHLKVLHVYIIMD